MLALLIASAAEMDELNWWHLLFVFIAGVLARGVGTLGVHFFRTAVLPWISNATYKHIDISHDGWIIKHTDQPGDGETLESEWRMKVRLKQNGQTISGDADAECIKGIKQGTSRRYVVNGKLSNGVAAIQLYAESSSFRSQSSFLLKVVGDGSILEGHRLFLGMNRDLVRTVPCRWSKDESSQLAQCGPA
jgi:hypothetical protein